MESSIDAQFLIITECMNVTSAMRKSSRWLNAGIAAILGAPSTTATEKTTQEENEISQRISNGAANVAANTAANTAVTATAATAEPASPSSANTSETNSLSATPETDLVMGFAAVRPELTSNPPGEFSTLPVVKPFLDVIESPLVSGYITSLALTSLEKFFVLGIISDKSRDIKQSLSEILHTLAHCRFEATDRQEDDAVLLQLMGLIDTVVSGHCGYLLSESAVTDVVDTCITMAKQMKRRDSLRRSVVATLQTLARVLFTVKGDEIEAAADSMFVTLVDILDPAEIQHANNIRITALQLLKLVFEVNGQWATTDRTTESMQKLWKYLAQLIRVNNSPRLVREALQLVITIQNTAPTKSQFEFVLVYLLTSLTPMSDLPRDESTDDMFYAGVPNRALCVKSAPKEPGSNVLTIPTAAQQKTPEIREVMVEALAALAVSSPTLFSDLYVTYDCDMASPDLSEDLIGFLCRNAYPDSATWSTASVPPLCLEAVLSGISAWAAASSGGGGGTTNLTARLSAKQGKALEAEVADIFNKSPAKGIAALKTHGFVQSDSPEEIARFLHTCKRLNKAVLGKYFAKSENRDVLAEYVKIFDFSGLRIDEALRVMLVSFRLPGESAQIENLLQKFADHYIESGNKVEKSSDSAFILAYAVLMLNTDHYSPTLKRRMDFEAFKRNVQGVDKDIPNDYVQAIYDGITSQEIVMPEEHDTDETFEHSWRENVQQQQQQATTTPQYFSGTSESEVVKAIFDTNWRPIVSTLSFVFATATDDLVFRRVISGFHQLALLAARFKSQQALTHIIACLSQISALSSGDLSFKNSNIEVRIEDHTSVIVSDLSTQFGGDLKAQMASITLFRILNVAAEEVSRAAYTLVAKSLANLYLYGLGTPASVAVQPVAACHTFERSKAGKPVGILSALSNYLTSSPDTPPEPSDENVDAALGAAECIKACKIDDTIAALVRGSASNFANGALDALPLPEQSQSPEQYRLAQDFLLRLAGRAAQDVPELRRTVCDKAVALGFNATALLIAPPESADEIINGLDEVEPDMLDTLLNLPPSYSLWRAFELLKNPDARVLEYIQHHIASIDEKSVSHVLTYLSLGTGSGSGSGTEETILSVLALLAKQFRHKKYYTEVLALLGSFCGSASGTARETALSELQRELLAEDQELSWAQAAQRVVIPEVLEVLLKPEVWKRDPSGMNVTRQQAASMIGKVFLHLTVSLDKQETGDDREAWVSVLKIIDRLLSSRRQPALNESIVEMLKNVILVTKLASRGSPEFWHSTEQELKGFLPQIAEMVSQQPESLKVNNDSGSSDSTTTGGNATGGDATGGDAAGADATNDDLD